MKLQDVFYSLLNDFTKDTSRIDKYWNDIRSHYSGRKRYYHNLNHLENLYEQLVGCKKQITDWNTILFTLFYHDIIYKATKSDNEEQSALFAEDVMMDLGVSSDLILKCKAQILATKWHQVDIENDTNYFTDADLSILGQGWEFYEKYYTGVRKEYAIYPSLMYNPGRAKVLRHFLSMKSIFKTSLFIEQFEEQARLNIKEELKILDK